LAGEIQHLRVFDRIRAILDKLLAEVDRNGETNLDNFVLRGHQQHELNERSFIRILFLGSDIGKVIASECLRQVPRFERLFVERRVLLVVYLFIDYDALNLLRQSLLGLFGHLCYPVHSWNLMESNYYYSSYAQKTY
jgi:hypothetical protein